MSRGREDYIKTIYQLSSHMIEDEYVSNQSLVTELGHSAQTVNEMIKKLVAKELVIYKRYKGTKLTATGIELAVKMIRRHRLWELFLVEKLGYSWEQVHIEAENLEHVTSDLMEERLYTFLKEPAKCPHGNIIPSLDGSILEDESIDLSQGKVDLYYQFTKVKDDKDLLLYLDKIGFSINDSFKVVKVDFLNELIKIEKNTLEHESHSFGLKVAKKIYIKEI